MEYLIYSILSINVLYVIMNFQYFKFGAPAAKTRIYEIMLVMTEW